MSLLNEQQCLINQTLSFSRRTKLLLLLPLLLLLLLLLLWL